MVCLRLFLIFPFPNKKVLNMNLIEMKNVSSIGLLKIIRFSTCNTCNKYITLVKKNLINLVFISLQFCLALRYFSTGSNYNDVAAFQGVTKGLVSVCVAEVSDFLSSISSVHIRFPIRRDQQARMSRAHYEKFGHNGCMGAIDGTHIAIISPKENEPAFYNRKNYHSINTMVRLVLIILIFKKKAVYFIKTK